MGKDLIVPLGAGAKGALPERVGGGGGGWSSIPLDEDGGS